MIICPNCNKRITTIPGKQLTISCTCKCTLRTCGHFLESHSKKAIYKDKPIQLVYIHGSVHYHNSNEEDFIPKKEFIILDGDNQQMIHLDFHPTWEQLPQTEFEKKLKTYLVFS